MAKQHQSFDPITMWRDAFSRWESAYQGLARTSLAPAEYMRLVGQFVTMSVRTQQIMAELMMRSLRGMPMPLGANSSDVTERLRAVEEHLGLVSPSGKARAQPTARSSRHRLQSAQAAAASAAKPARRTRKKKSKA